MYATKVHSSYRRNQPAFWMPRIPGPRPVRLGWPVATLARQRSHYCRPAWTRSDQPEPLLNPFMTLDLA